MDIIAPSVLCDKSHESDEDRSDSSRSESFLGQSTTGPHELEKKRPRRGGDTTMMMMMTTMSEQQESSKNDEEDDGDGSEMSQNLVSYRHTDEKSKKLEQMRESLMKNGNAK